MNIIVINNKKFKDHTYQFKVTVGVQEIDSHFYNYH